MAKADSTRTTSNTEQVTLDQNSTPSLSDCMDQLYDAVALMDCASASLDDCNNDSAIRVLYLSKGIAIDVINGLVRMQLSRPEIEKITEYVRSDGRITQ
jgi:hypothetical protein